MKDNQFNKAQEWFEDLRDQLLNIITEIDERRWYEEKPQTALAAKGKALIRRAAAWKGKEIGEPLV